MEDYYFKFMISDYYIFIAVMVVLVITIITSCCVIIYHNSKHYKIIAKRKMLEIYNAELIRSLREENNVK